MASHDAAMRRFAQWWRRAVRNGYGFAQGFALGPPGERLWTRQLKSIWLWTAALPIGIALAVLLFGPQAAFLLLLYPLQVLRLALRGTRSPRLNWAHAALLMLGKFAELLGQLAWLRRRRA